MQVQHCYLGMAVQMPLGFCFGNPFWTLCSGPRSEFEWSVKSSAGYMCLSAKSISLFIEVRRAATDTLVIQQMQSVGTARKWQAALVLLGQAARDVKVRVDENPSP